MSYVVVIRSFSPRSPRAARARAALSSNLA